MSDAMHVEDQVAEALLQKNIVVDQSTPVGDDSGPSYSEDLQMVSRYNNNTTGAQVQAAGMQNAVGQAQVGVGDG